MARGTASSTTTPRTIGRSRPWTAGTRSRTSSSSTWPSASSPRRGKRTMCTMIAMKIPVTGGGKGATGWFSVSEAIVGYDHTTYMKNEHALLLDFVNPDLDPSARVAVELDIASAKALLAQLKATIEAAEESGVPE